MKLLNWTSKLVCSRRRAWARAHRRWIPHMSLKSNLFRFMYVFTRACVVNRSREYLIEDVQVIAKKYEIENKFTFNKFIFYPEKISKYVQNNMFHRKRVKCIESRKSVKIVKLYKFAKKILKKEKIIISLSYFAVK